MSVPSSQPEPNWYPDPTMEGRLRWWTGEAWSEHVHPPEEQPVAPAVAPLAAVETVATPSGAATEALADVAALASAGMLGTGGLLSDVVQQDAAHAGGDVAPAAEPRPARTQWPIAAEGEGGGDLTALWDAMKAKWYMLPLMIIVVTVVFFLMEAKFGGFVSEANHYKICIGGGLVVAMLYWAIAARKAHLQLWAARRGVALEPLTNIPNIRTPVGKLGKRDRRQFARTVEFSGITITTGMHTYLQAEETEHVERDGWFDSHRGGYETRTDYLGHARDTLATIGGRNTLVWALVDLPGEWTHRYPGLFFVSAVNRFGVPLRLPEVKTESGVLAARGTIVRDPNAAELDIHELLEPDVLQALVDAPELVCWQQVGSKLVVVARHRCSYRLYDSLVHTAVALYRAFENEGRHF